MSGDSFDASDISQIILETTNSLCGKLLNSIDENLYKFLDKIIFINEDITSNSYFLKIFGTSTNSGILMLANCLLLAFILYYCIRIIISRFSGTEIETPSQFFLRSILAAITMNASLEICKILIIGTNQISTFFCSLGENIFGETISFANLISILNSTSSTNFNIFSLDGIFASMISISAFTLLLSFSFRYILIQLLVLASPFAFLCISNKTTEPFLKSWYRSLISMLFIQIVISVILIIIYALLGENSNSYFNKILIIGAISALLKAGQLVKEFLGGLGITNNFQAGIAGLRSIISR